MKKAFYYNFMPSKAEEEEAIAHGKPHEITRTLVEIWECGDAPPPQYDPKHPWRIKKSVTANEVFNGKLLLSQNDVFEHIFRYWTMDVCNYVIKGNQFCVIIADYTDEENPKRFQGEDVFFQGNNDTYVLGWADVVRSRHLQPGDEIELFWDVSSATFVFKLLSKANPTKDS